MSCAKRFAQGGYKVAVSSRSKEKVDSAADALAQEFGGGDQSRFFGVVCDVTSRQSIHDAVDTVESKLGGPLDTVIYNAGPE